MKIITRKEAKAQDLKFYFTGKSCKRGHKSVRYVRDAACRECARLHSNNHYHSPKGQAVYRNRTYFRLYGLTYEDYKRLLAEQGEVCKVCSEPCIQNLSVDHCHETGKVRGLLCRNCNLALGYIKDNIATLEAMISYLKASLPYRTASA